MKTRTQSPQIQLLHDGKASCSKFGSSTVLAVLSLALLLGFSLNAPAFVLDSFSGSISGWSSISNGGSIYQSGGTFTVAAAAAANSRTSSKKTSLAFSNVLTHTIEFKVSVNSLSGPGQAVLGWVPTGGALGTNGYALCVGTNRVTILANSTVLYSTNEFVRTYADLVLHDDFVLPSSDMFLVMRMTPEGANVIVKSTVYRKSGVERTNILFEYTATNAPGIIGTEGNASLGAFNDGSATTTSVTFDDLHYFDTIRVVVDDFSGGPAGYPGTGWTDFIPGGSTNYVNGANQLVTVSPASPTIVSGTYRSDKVYKLTDGVRLEMRLDNLDLGTGGFDTMTLGYIPHGVADFSTLAEYFNAYTIGIIYLGKAVTSIYENGNQNFPLPQFNVRAYQILTCEGTTVRIESRLEDTSKDVNDPARVLHEYMHVDSSSAYIGFNGNFAITRYRLGGAGQDVIICDNAEVNKVPGASPPIVTTRSPADGKAFHAAADGLSFNVVADTNLSLGNIKLEFNGIFYTNGSPGVTITPGTPTATLRTFTFTNLATNVFYKGTIHATDDGGLDTDDHWEFSTFLTNDFQLEAEDFNYSDNVGVDGGKYIDGGLDAYDGKQGTPEIDYHDSRTSAGGTDYRLADFPRVGLTSDPARAQYVAASKTDYLVYDNNNNDWRNYTRTFSAGTYKVYSRQSTYAMPAGSLCSLERVSGDPTTTNQTTTGLGLFKQLADIAGDTGFDLHRFVELQDASGNPAVVRLAAGVATLRFTDRYVDDSEDSDVFHNYLIFVPTADPGTLRPIVALTAPAPGDKFRQAPATEALFASIANRDTTVTNVVALRMNGVSVPFTNTATSGGIDVTWSLASVPPTATITNTLIYKDSQGVSITNSWTYGYPTLYATNRLVGGLPLRGFSYKVAQVDSDPLHDNSILYAETYLTDPPGIALDRTWSTNIQTLDWDDNIGVPKYTPGLDGGISGYGVGPYDNIATESLGYMYLTAGAHRFYALSDDGFQVRSGTSPSDTAATVLGFQNGTFNGTFDFVVEAEGLYPVRHLWEEGGGYADFHLSSRDVLTGANTVVNDPLNPSGVVKVFIPELPIQLQSSATVNGPYSVRTDAVFDSDAKTITVPISAGAQYYRLTSDSKHAPITINKVVALSGGNVLIKYQ